MAVHEQGLRAAAAGTPLDYARTGTGRTAPLDNSGRALLLLALLALLGLAVRFVVLV